MRKRIIQAGIDRDFYDKIEKERQKFIRKHNLNKLSTRAFTQVLANKSVFKWNEDKKIKKYKRR